MLAGGIMGSIFKRNQGHSVVEMCLLASLVACACIGAVILVAGGFNDSLSVVKSDLSNRARAAKIQSMMAPVYVSDPSIYNANGGKALLVNERVCVGATGNICVEVPQMSAQMLSETSGGMGAQFTEELSLSLQ